MIRDRIFDGLTFDDILLVPGYAEIHPSEVSLKSKLTRKLECNIPLLSAAMDTVQRPTQRSAWPRKAVSG